MTFPVVASTSSGHSTAPASSHSITYPSGISAGDLLLLWVSAEPGDDVTFAGFDGWSQVTGIGSAEIGLFLYAKIAGSALSGTFTFDDTSDVVQIAWVCRRITGADSIATIEASTNASNNVPPDPPTLSAGGGVQDNLWMIGIAWRDDISISTYPTDYTGNQVMNRYADASGVGVATSTRNLADDTDDPESCSLSDDDTFWASITAVVKPMTGGSGPASLAIAAEGTGLAPVVASAGSGPASIAINAQGTGLEPAGGYGVASLTITSQGTGDNGQGGSGPASLTLSTQGTGSKVSSGSGSASLVIASQGTGLASGASSGYGSASLVLGTLATGHEQPGGSGSASLTMDFVSLGGATPSGHGGPMMCCCDVDCVIAADDFNRADGDPGSGWFGDGVIASNLLASDMDRTTVCHPAYAPKGSFWSRSTMRNAADGSVFVIQVGDPAADYRVRVTFAGTFGVDGTLTIRVEDGTDFEEWEYVWELADEILYVCWQPDVQLSARPESRTSEAPNWVTMCVSTTGAKCWTV